MKRKHLFTKKNINFTGILMYDKTVVHWFEISKTI
ncbi:ACD_00520 [African swine fever virus]|uniref:ACD_00520 n=1 Tax=African swine fever virus TaxID=10497 RepID=A0A385KLZ0_ASF|nr:ACD_00520 [African swine fever virus]AXZ95992.1 ACD_00520 [African swine fever virus]AXZ96087.1 ACD_00520 [African swine fever virus]